MKKLYISDLDGTLLNNEKEVSEYTRDVINQLIAGGLHFSIATARTAATVVKILDGLQINLPVVLMNGVMIYDLKKAKYLKIEYVPEKTVKAIITVLKEYNLTGFMYAVLDGRLVTYYEDLKTTAMQEFYQERVTRYQKTFEQTASFMDITAGNNIIYFALLDEQKPLTFIYDTLKIWPDIDLAFYKDTYGENLWVLEIYSQRASKFNAVNYLRKYYGFERIIGFGDNLNDLPLFKACDESYAVAGAVEQLKEKATAVIGANHEDGVARFLVEKEVKRMVNSTIDNPMN
ncbi:MAG TPA: HAD family hydrolase [Bacillota bacterium]|nr:HAD family hydrolase [Bacillota bacterium]